MCEEGYEEACARVIDAECRRLLQNLRHKAQVQVVRDYFASHGGRKPKKKCRGKFLKKEEYMKVIAYILKAFFLVSLI